MTLTYRGGRSRGIKICLLDARPCRTTPGIMEMGTIHGSWRERVACFRFARADVLDLHQAGFQQSIEMRKDRLLSGRVEARIDICINSPDKGGHALNSFPERL